MILMWGLERSRRCPPAAGVYDERGFGVPVRVPRAQAQGRGLALATFENQLHLNFDITIRKNQTKNEYLKSGGFVFTTPRGCFCASNRPVPRVPHTNQCKCVLCAVDCPCLASCSSGMTFANAALHLKSGNKKICVGSPLVSTEKQNATNSMFSPLPSILITFVRFF